MAGLGGFSMVITMTLFCCFILLHGGVAVRPRYGGYGGSFDIECTSKDDKARWEEFAESGAGDIDVPSKPPPNKFKDGTDCHHGYKVQNKDDPEEQKRFKAKKEAYKQKCQESYYVPPLKKINKHVNDKLGSRCQSGTCHYHYEIEQFVCRSSSVQATFGLIAVLLVGLCLRQVIS